MKKLIFSIIAGSFIFTGVYALPLSPTDFSNHPYAGTYKDGVIPSEEEMAKGLKDALQTGATNAANILHQPGGYFNNPVVKIPFPPDAIKVEQKLRELGFGAKVDKFVENMNRAAEDAAIKAAPIFGNAITSMTVTDAKNILLGADNSATMYFKGKTSGALYLAFSPVIKEALDKANATKLWAELTGIYNKVPFVKPIQTDLVKYATNKALDGVFIKIAEEEKKIRSSGPVQVNDTMKKVFGWASSMMK